MPADNGLQSGRCGRLSDTERQTLHAIAEHQEAGDDSSIDLREIPRLTDEQLASMTRLREVGQTKVPVSLRLDPRGLAWLKSKGSAI